MAFLIFFFLRIFVAIVFWKEEVIKRWDWFYGLYFAELFSSPHIALLQLSMAF